VPADILAAMRYWIPPALWTAVILAASSDVMSAAHTAPWLATIANAIFGHPLPPEQFDLLHAAVRKGGHLTEYGILGALLFRALRGGRPTRWSVRWGVAAVSIAAVVAAVDEWHQTFVPSRSGSVGDVGIDVIGATLAQILIRAAQVLFFIT
jgi:VanZ family protein